MCVCVTVYVYVFQLVSQHTAMPVRHSIMQHTDHNGLSRANWALLYLPGGLGYSGSQWPDGGICIAEKKKKEKL